MAGERAATRPVAAALAEAAAVARLAPSVHNTQPWRWVVAEDQMELYAERSRQLPVADPAGWLLLISCGAALHHAEIALAAEGWRADIERLPGGDPDLLARIRVSEQVPVTPEAMRLVQAAEMRHTDRRAVSDIGLPPGALDALQSAAQAGGVRLHVLRPDQIDELASLSAHADDVGLEDPGQREETATWVGGTRNAGVGVPDSAVPGAAPRTNVPLRDFGHLGGLDPSTRHDRAAVYTVLFGQTDDDRDWLRAGEGLSALWLTATELGVSVLPFSSVIEIGSTREQLRRRVLSGLGLPYLVLRLGVADPDHAGPGHTGRLAPEETIQRATPPGSPAPEAREKG